MVASLVGGAILLFSCAPEKKGGEVNVETMITQQSDSLTMIFSKNGRKEYRGNIDGNFLLVKAEGVENLKRLRYLYSRPWHATVYNEVNLPLGAFHIDAP
jgi:hypothetical protein